MIDALDNDKANLQAARIEVVQAVLDTGGQCLAAARVARKASFPYAAITAAQEQQWEIRSTPTSWLVDNTGEAILYVEGIVDLETLLALAKQKESSQTKAE